MPIESSELEMLLKSGFPDADVTVLDMAGDKDHYQVKITAAAFAGKSRVMQHKMVYEALGAKRSDIHALSIITATK